MSAAPFGAGVEPIVCPEYPASVRSLVGVLAWQRERMPDRLVCHRVARSRDGLRSDTMTVEELAVRSSSAAARLRAAGVREGDRVILSLADPHDFLVGFFGTLFAGASAVPLPTAGELGAPRSFRARIRSVCADCAPAAAIVERVDRFVRIGGTLPSGTALLAP